jgi:hypothetical protein
VNVERICQSCGEGLDDDSVFCGKCGAKWSAPAAAAKALPVLELEDTPRQRQLPPSLPPTQAPRRPPAQAPQQPRAQEQRQEQPKRGKPMMTQLASKALNMSDMFNAVLKTPFPGWTANANAPVGHSTGGGQLATQSISIISPEGGTLTVGRVDWSQSEATVRSHGQVALMYQQRFNSDFPIDEDAYKGFVRRVETYLRGCSVQVSLDRGAQAQAGTAARSAGSSTVLWIVIAVIIIAALLGVAWLLL